MPFDLPANGRPAARGYQDSIKVLVATTARVSSAIRGAGLVRSPIWANWSEGGVVKSGAVPRFECALTELCDTMCSNR